MIPRYLFRAYSPGSDGINNSMGFSCQAISEECNTIASLKDLERQDARRMLKDHVLWASWKVRQDDILISFSSSFLFTVQHCIRKIEKCYNTTKDNCFITILDTKCYPDDTFQWTVDLLRKYNLDEYDHRNLLHTYHEGEYLAEHELYTSAPEQACHVSFSSIEASMYRIAPDLKEPQHRNNLVYAMRAFRAQWYSRPEVVSDSNIRQALTLASNFGGKWFLPMSVWGLAMRHREQNSIRMLADRLIGMDDFPFPYMYRDRTVVPATLRELQEWKDLMESLFLRSENRKREDDPVGGLLGSFPNLGIAEN
ncbi:uncharacterized protein HMPREF1541_01369 [Cyphellophora europaea CBS 101466]|uniref:DUF7587 domain-containing protein n=1 Tax=Cyphellophora europaea (strain CBS 101466) TaxID=1220924 RepID=W2SGP2_CYPE1|nr:uncharacterized protein HMPREF1541_01369 [Cyphellophora europaea CBS 101466]ETN47178.1 hypothetical protein HMPREF1541_01369 [Cyphellophora europaea CBS 101466]